MSASRLRKTILITGAVTGWLLARPILAQPAPPNFAENPSVAWLPVGGGAGGFSPIPGRVPPLADDPAHPYVANNNPQGRQPTDRIGDLGNLNLKPWVKEAMRK